MDARSTLHKLSITGLVLASLFVTAQADDARSASSRPKQVIDYGLSQHSVETAHPTSDFAFTYERLRRGLMSALASSEWSVRATPGTPHRDLWQNAALGGRPDRAGITSFLPMPMDDGGLFVEVEVKY